MMKRMMLVLSVLVFLSFACANFGGGGNDTNTSGTEDNNIPSDAPAGDGSPEEDVEEPSEVEEDPPAPVPDTPCYNPFYPMAAGESYLYLLTYSDMDGGQETEEFRLVTVDETDETLTVQMRFDDFSSEVDWVCGPDGLYSTEYALFNLGQFGDMDIETISYDGLSLPAEEMWYIGSTWEINYDINMIYSVEDMVMTNHAIGHLEYEVAGIETITVPVGTYPDAYRVETTGFITLEMKTPDGATVVSPEMPMEFVTWYVKGVGMIKQDSSNAEDGVNITELIAVE